MGLRQNVFRVPLTVGMSLLAMAVAVGFAGPAEAAPDCTDLGPFTRICQNAGHSAITTTPNPAIANPWPGWGLGGIPAFGLGGGGIWLGY